MKVYVITSGEYSDYGIRAVALSREKAELICAMLNSTERDYGDVATIEEYDTDEIQCDANEDVGLCYEAAFNYKTLKNIYFDEPFYSFTRNEIKREISGHGYEIIIAATFPKDMPQEKARKIVNGKRSKRACRNENMMKICDVVRLCKTYGENTTLAELQKEIQGNKIHKCPKCSGTGKITKKRNKAQYWECRDDYEYYDVECDLCNGQGYTEHMYKPKMIQDGWK